VYPAHQTIGLPSLQRQELHSPGKLQRYATLRGASTVETAAKIVETTTIEFGLRPEQQKLLRRHAHSALTVRYPTT